MATYADLVARISADHKIPKAQARRILKTLVGAVTESLSDDQPFRIPGMGTLSTRPRAARVITDPHGHDHTVPATKAVHFSVSKDLRAVVNRRKGSD